MADNVTLNSGSGGATAASDDIGGIQYQRVKVNFGGDGSATDVSAGNPLPVTGHQTEDAAHGSGATGMFILGVRNDTLASLVSADGDYAPLQVNADGALYVNDGNLDSVTGTVGNPSPNDVIVIGAQDSVGDVRQPLILNTSNDAQSDAQLALLTTTRLFGYNGTAWDRLRLDGSDNLNVNLNASGAVVSVDDNGGSLTVDGTVTANAGTGTFTVQEASALDVSAATVTIDGAHIAAEGAALGSGVLLQGDDGTDRKNVAVDATSGNVQCDVASALPAGDNNIGNVDVASALPAGDNNIGNVDIVSFPDNEPFDLNQVGGNAVNTGTGNAGTGTQRVVLASDQPALDASAATVTVTATALDNIDTNTTRPSNHYRNVDANAEDAIKGSAGTLHWIHAMNLTSAVAYLHLYDATTGNVTPGTTTPDFTFPIATQGDTNGAGFTLRLDEEFANAITLVVTTTIDGSTGDPGTNGVIVNAGYS